MSGECKIMSKMVSSSNALMLSSRSNNDSTLYIQTQRFIFCWSLFLEVKFESRIKGLYHSSILLLMLVFSASGSASFFCPYRRISSAIRFFSRTYYSCCLLKAKGRWPNTSSMTVWSIVSSSNNRYANFPIKSFLSLTIDRVLYPHILMISII